MRGGLGSLDGTPDLGGGTDDGAAGGGVGVGAVRFIHVMLSAETACASHFCCKERLHLNSQIHRQPRFRR